MMNVFIFSRTEVTAKEERLNAREKSGVGRHHVFKVAVLRASLTHENLTVVFNNLCFDFTRMLVHQRFERCLTSDDGVTNFFYATGTETVCLARKAEWRRGALVRFEQWTGSPVRPNRLAFGKPFVNTLKRFPGDI